MPDIYDQHRAAFAKVSAYVVIDEKGQRVASVAFKFGNAVTCYLHIFGVQMVKATAGGGGYDRQSAAVAKAADKVNAQEAHSAHVALVERITFAVRKHDGCGWERLLRDAGLTVMQAV